MHSPWSWSPAPSRRALLINLRLGAALLRLPIVVHILILALGLAIARHTRHRAAERARHAVADAAAQVAQLALGLLLLARRVLLLALALQALGADEAADGLLRGPDVLVPRAGPAVRVVLGHAALGGGGERADLADGVRGVGLGGAFVMVGLALGLKERVGEHLGAFRRRGGGARLPLAKCCR